MTVVNLTPRGIELNRVLFSKPVPLDKLEGLLLGPYREQPVLVNRKVATLIRFYDECGIVCHCDAESKMVFSWRVQMIAPSPVLPTKRSFGGRLDLNGAEIKQVMPCGDLPVFGEMAFFKMAGDIWCWSGAKAGSSVPGAPFCELYITKHAGDCLTKTVSLTLPK